MATALDKNGREVRVGDRICSTIDPAYVGTAAEVPCGTLGIRVSYDTDHAYAEAREWYSAPENLKLLNAPPLVKDANGNELRVGDEVGSMYHGGPRWAVLGFEGDDLVEIEDRLGTVVMARAGDVHRTTPPPRGQSAGVTNARHVSTSPTPPPPAKDAAGGTLGDKDGPVPCDQCGWVVHRAGLCGYCLNSPSVAVDGEDGGIYEPAIVPTISTSERAAELFGVGSAVHGYWLGFEKHKRQSPVHDGLESQATRIRELARERIRDRYATCDWDDPVRIADAEDYVLGLVGLVARVERDLGTVGELGPGFRRTMGDVRGYHAAQGDR